MNKPLKDRTYPLILDYLLHGHSLRALSLSLLAVGNFFLFYVASIALARKLSVSDFDDYNVALSIVTVLGALSTLGLEKYALRCLPVYQEREDWSHAHGFWRFSLRTIMLVSVGLVLLLTLALSGALTGQPDDSHLAVVVLTSFLPIIAVVLFLVEVATAHGAQIQAVVIYRFMVPASFFVLIHLLGLFDIPHTAMSVAITYGLAWVLALIALYHLVRHAIPPGCWRARPAYLSGKWLRRGMPFLFNSWMLSVIASSGVIILELLFTSSSVVGVYAVAAQTGTFIVLLANTTNRFYLPLMSTYMERRDKTAMRHLSTHRFVVLGGLTLLFFGGVVIFGREILGWFGNDFREGYEVLCILAAGASVNALFSDSPYYLQFIKRQRGVFITTALALLLNLTLTVLLGFWFQGVGAALGYALSMSLLFLTQRLLAAYHLKRYWLTHG